MFGWGLSVVGCGDRCILRAPVEPYIVISACAVVLQAFIDFEDKECAALALERLQGFKLSSTHILHLNFAK